MWGGLSGHVLADDEELAAEIETETAYFTPHLDIFVTHFGVVQTYRENLLARVKPVPAIPSMQETSFPGLDPSAGFY